MAIRPEKYINSKHGELQAKQHENQLWSATEDAKETVSNIQQLIKMNYDKWVRSELVLHIYPGFEADDAIARAI